MTIDHNVSLTCQRSWWKAPNIEQCLIDFQFQVEGPSGYVSDVKYTGEALVPAAAPYVPAPAPVYKAAPAPAPAPVEVLVNIPRTIPTT